MTLWRGSLEVGGDAYAVEEGGDTSSAMEKTIGRLQLRYEILLNRLQTPAGETPKSFITALDVPSLLNAGESFAEFASFADKLASGMKSAKKSMVELFEATTAGFKTAFESVRLTKAQIAGLRDIFTSGGASLEFDINAGGFSIGTIFGAFVGGLANVATLIDILITGIADLISAIFNWSFWTTKPPAPGPGAFGVVPAHKGSGSGMFGPTGRLHIDRSLFTVNPEPKSMLAAALPANNDFEHMTYDTGKPGSTVRPPGINDFHENGDFANIFSGMKRYIDRSNEVLDRVIAGQQ